MRVCIHPRSLGQAPNLQGQDTDSWSLLRRLVVDAKCSTRYESPSVHQDAIDKPASDSGIGHGVRSGQIRRTLFLVCVDHPGLDLCPLVGSAWLSLGLSRYPKRPYPRRPCSLRTRCNSIAHRQLRVCVSLEVDDETVARLTIQGLLVWVES